MSIIVVPIATSPLQSRRGPTVVEFPSGTASLPKASVVNVSQILTVSKAELVECVGSLSGTAIAAVSEGLNLLFDRL